MSFLYHKLFIYFAEVRMFVRGEKCDVCGIGVSLFAIFGIFIGLSWVPLAEYLEWDALFLVVNQHFPPAFQNKLSNIIVLGIRHCWTEWCILESSRLYILVLISSMMIGNSYLAIVLNVRKDALGDKALKL